MNGILLVNKPGGWTSHDVCNFVKRRFKIAKVGHTGTLDPQATGVLVLLLGKFTKLATRFADDEKAYDGTIELGMTTTTQDGEGDVVASTDEWKHISREKIEAVVQGFVGEQLQLPPMASAVKVDGVRLYKLARKGKVVERKPRPIVIHEIVCTNIDLPYISLSVVVSKGTYVRTIAHDIGAALGVGAYLKSLRRTRSGKFSLEECVSVEELKQLTDTSELKKHIRSLHDDCAAL